jgi:steroid delta-isomerase-like uncharacterized protein
MNLHLRRSQPRNSLFVANALSRRAALGRLGAGFGLGLGLLTRAQGAVAQESTPMTEAATPPFLDTWLTVWNEDPSQAEVVYTDDAVLEDVPAGVNFEGREAVQGHVEEIFAAFPEHESVVQSAFAAGDWAAVEYLFTATYTGTFPGLPPGAGQEAILPAVSIMELADGRIRREAHYYDAYALLIQLGALPAPGAEGTPAP